MTRQTPVVENSLVSGRYWRTNRRPRFYSQTSIAKNAPDSDREVAMSEEADLRIDIEAAKALVYWKSLFADEVVARARRLAVESG